MIILGAQNVRPCERTSVKRGVAPEVSAQRGTSGATNGGGGPQAPPTRLSLWRPVTNDELITSFRVLVQARFASPGRVVCLRPSRRSVRRLLPGSGVTRKGQARSVPS